MYNRKMIKLGDEKSDIRELFEYGNARKKIVGSENVFDFSIGNPGVPAPKCVQEEVERLLRETPAVALHGYSSAPGLSEVRAAVSNYIQSEFGAEMRPDLVYMTCGAAASLTVTLNAILTEGDEVVTLAPFFPEYRVFVERAGGTLVVAPTDEKFHLDAQKLKPYVGKRTKAVLLNSPNNPTGAVYTEQEIKALAALLKEKSEEKGEPILLLADEPYRELTYGAKVPYVMNYYAHSVVLYSFSKSLSLAGERIGYIAVSPKCAGAEELFSAVCGAGRALGYVCAPVLFQRVVAKCLGKSSDVGEYKKNRDILYNALTEYGYECISPEGAFYLFVKALEPEAKKFCERAKKHELLLVPSDSFGVTGYVRISYCVERSVIERSLPAFKALIEEYRK